MSVSLGAKKDPLRISFVLVGDNRLNDWIGVLERNCGNGFPTRGTIYARASTARTIERPTEDYKVPDELKPKNRPAPMFETPQQAQERIQLAIIEADQLREKIMADARKKGKTEKVTVFQTPAPCKDAVPT